MAKKYSIVFTCEHGGNRVPARYSQLFRGKKKLLESHRGYDSGALELARKLSSAFRSPLHYSTVTRLLIDLNRSPSNPSRFSEITRTLSLKVKESIAQDYHIPFHEGIEAAIRNALEAGTKVLHISVHSFAASLRGKKRNADLGLLYDPKRKRELEFCARWRKALLSIDGSIRVRYNYPYRGTSNGLTSFLRGIFDEEEYIGIEIEVNQIFPKGERTVWLRMMQNIVSSLQMVLGISVLISS